MDITLISSIAAFAAGALGASAFFWARQAKLQAQIKSDEEFAARFAQTAQEALKSNNELFLQLAEEKLKSAQADGAHDLDKRSQAIDALVKPMHDKLEGLAKALAQSEGTQQSLKADLQHLNSSFRDVIAFVQRF